MTRLPAAANPLAFAHVTEKSWQGTVIAVAKTHGWMVYHTHDSRKSAPGFPDILAISPTRSRLVVAELKTSIGVVSPEQDRWLKAFAEVRTSPMVYIWRPGDLEEINEVLGGQS